jgi:ABC-2 type transport system permease protein
MIWLNSFLLETKCEFLKLMRTPDFSLPLLIFPLFFYLLFGVAFGAGKAASLQYSTYLLASYGCFGLLGTAIFGFGASLAVEREQGWLTLKRTTPMYAASFLAARTTMCLMFGMIILCGLALCGVLFAGVKLSGGQWAIYFAVSAASILPFSVIGLVLGLTVGAKAAPGVANLVYLPLGLASGLWFPLEILPGFFKKLAPLLPPYHINQILLGAFGASAKKGEGHVLFLVLFTVLGFLMVNRLYQRACRNL